MWGHIHGHIHIVIVCFLGLQWIFHQCLRCAEILKMAEAEQVLNTSQGKSKEELCITVMLPVHKTQLQ